MPTTDTDVPSHYDPQELFADTFDDGMLAHHIAPALTCLEVNVLAGLLDAQGRHDGARSWLSVHTQQDCDEPHRH